MSHTTRVSDVRVHNVQALFSAVDALQRRSGVRMTIKENADCRLWATSKVRCAVVVTVDGCRFDVGFEKAKDGIGLVPVFDSHGDELYQHLGQGREQAKTAAEQALCNIGKLMQEYAYHAVQHEALMQGATVAGTMNEAGQYVLTVAN